MANPALALFDDEPMPPRARPGRLALFAVAANDNAPSSHRNALSKEQRMTGKVARTTDPLGEPTVTTYDAVDRPVFVTDAAGHVGGKTYDLAGEDLSETSGVGTPLLQTDAAFTYGADGEKLTVTDANSNLTQLAYDGFNRLLIALAAGGEASQIYTWDSYGANTNPASDTASGPNSYLYRYTGQRLDFTTGLYDYKARDYSPSLGRFIQPDPAGLDQGPNLYAYVGNNPVNAGDPDGMCNTHSGCYGDSGAVETGLPAPGASDTSVVSGAVPGSGTGAGAGGSNVGSGSASTAKPTGGSLQNTQLVMPFPPPIIPWGLSESSANQLAEELDRLIAQIGSNIRSAINDNSKQILYHYTDEKSASEISATGTIRQSGGKVYVTDEALSPQAASDNLFAGMRGPDAASSVAIVVAPRDLPLVRGPSTGWGMIHHGSLRDGRHVGFLYVGPNPFRS